MKFLGALLVGLFLSGCVSSGGMIDPMKRVASDVYQMAKDGSAPILGTDAEKDLPDEKPSLHQLQDALFSGSLLLSDNGEEELESVDRKKMEEFYQAGKNEELLALIYEAEVPQNLTYFYLGSIAENQRKYAAAIHYYEMAELAYQSGSGVYKCEDGGWFGDHCNGLVLQQAIQEGKVSSKLGMQKLPREVTLNFVRSDVFVSLDGNMVTAVPYKFLLTPGRYPAFIWADDLFLELTVTIDEAASERVSIDISLDPGISAVFTKDMLLKYASILDDLSLQISSQDPFKTNYDYLYEKLEESLPVRSLLEKHLAVLDNEAQMRAVFRSFIDSVDSFEVAVLDAFRSTVDAKAGRVNSSSIGLSDFDSQIQQLNKIKAMRDSLLTKASSWRDNDAKGMAIKQVRSSVSSLELAMIRSLARNLDGAREKFLISDDIDSDVLGDVGQYLSVVPSLLVEIGYGSLWTKDEDTSMAHEQVQSSLLSLERDIKAKISRIKFSNNEELKNVLAMTQKHGFEISKIPVYINAKYKSTDFLNFSPPPLAEVTCEIALIAAREGELKTNLEERTTSLGQGRYVSEYREVSNPQYYELQDRVLDAEMALSEAKIQADNTRGGGGAGLSFLSGVLAAANVSAAESNLSDLRRQLGSTARTNRERVVADYSVTRVHAKFSKHASLEWIVVPCGDGEIQRYASAARDIEIFSFYEGVRSDDLAGLASSHEQEKDRLSRWSKTMPKGFVVSEIEESSLDNLTAYMSSDGDPKSIIKQFLAGI